MILLVYTWAAPPCQAAARPLLGQAALGVPGSSRRSSWATQTARAAAAAAAGAAVVGVQVRRRSTAALGASPAAAAPGTGSAHLAVVEEEEVLSCDAGRGLEQLGGSDASSESLETAELHLHGAATDGTEPAPMPALASKPARQAVDHEDQEDEPSSWHSNGSTASGGPEDIAPLQQLSAAAATAASGARSSWVPADRRRGAQQQQQQQRRQQQQPHHRRQQQRKQRQQQEAEAEVVLAGRRYDSLLDVRFQMRALQRELLGQADEVEVPRGSPHFAMIEAVFALHPQRAQKARDPIRSFFIVRNPYVLGGKGCEFQFEDARGVRDDFSLLKCTRPPSRHSKRARLLEACAHAVSGQLAEVAAAAAADPSHCSPAGGLLCARCGLDFKVQVAYRGWPLSKLVHAYREREAPCRAPTKFGQDPQTQQATLRQQPGPDADWARGWADFHRRHAQLAPLCKCCQGAAADARRAWRLAAEGDRLAAAARLPPA